MPRLLSTAPYCHLGQKSRRENLKPESLCVHGCGFSRKGQSTHGFQWESVRSDRMLGRLGRADGSTRVWGVMGESLRAWGH